MGQRVARPRWLFTHPGRKIWSSPIQAGTCVRVIFQIQDTRFLYNPIQSGQTAGDFPNPRYTVPL
jgi:hypothetical protein